MTCIAGLLILVLQLSPSAAAAPYSSQSGELKTKLNRRVSDYNLGVLSFVAALVRVSNDFQIPVGITWINTPSARGEVRFAWRDATVKEILEAIAKTQPGYEVKEENGVVHIFAPIPNAENFLMSRTGDFAVNNSDVELAYFKLHQLLIPRKSGNMQISIGSTGDSKVTVRLRNPTAQDILDALNIASNRKIWVVTFSEDPQLTKAGMRRSITLWNSHPVDPDLPGWDSVRWGDPTPPLLLHGTQ